MAWNRFYSSTTSTETNNNPVDFVNPPTFAGPDVHAYIGNIKVATLSSLTYSITNEIQPQYTCGYRPPRSFVRGKIAIAGSMTFAQFDRHAIIKALIEPLMGGAKQTYDVQALLNATTTGSTTSTSSMTSLGTTTNDVYTLNSTKVSSAVAAARTLVLSRKFRYISQLPPFDMTVALANDQGDTAWMVIKGIRFANEGGGYSMDDLGNEIAVTYVATDILPLTNEDPTTTGM